MGAYPALERTIFDRGLKKNAIVKTLGITDRTLSNKLSGRVEFTWPEVRVIHQTFFPDVELGYLFEKRQNSA